MSAIGLVASASAAETVGAAWAGGCADGEIGSVGGFEGDAHAKSTEQATIRVPGARFVRRIMGTFERVFSSYMIYAGLMRSPKTNPDSVPASQTSSARRLLSFGGPLVAVTALITACLRPPDPSSAAEEAGKTMGGTDSNSHGSVASEAYTWKSVAIWGGGFVTGLVYSPVQAGILYARTDVGGAYRYDPKGQGWIPITDSLSPADSSFMGIESFAVDPLVADRVYLAAGMYTQDWAGGAAFMRSDDRGVTWKVFPAPFKMGGNELSRSDGERLAVDPHDPKVLYFGSRRNGLWKSDNEAASWTKVANFPASDDKEKGLGLVFVVFDPTSGAKGKETPGLYVGSQVDGRIYQSTDAGKSWKPVPNQPSTGFLPRRAVVDKDGTFYVTYALGDSPYALRDGAVYRYEPKKQAWTNITPLKPSEGDTFGYGGITVDPANPGTLVTTTMDRWSKGAEIFRSTDRGQTWKATIATASLTDGGAKHVYHHREKLGAPQWVGDIKIDPFNPNRAMIVEGGGVWATDNLGAADTGKPTTWSFHSKNLEELVARALISPPEGAPLLSAHMDICGFRHDNLEASPQEGAFKDPMCASAEDIDFAEKRPNVVVRVGTYPWDDTKSPRGALSTDGGKTWKQFGAEPKGSNGMGSVAVSADGSVVLWAARGAAVAYSRDGGKTWAQSEGLPAPANTPDWAPWNQQLASDRVNPKKLYVFDAPTGSVYVSEDGGAHFEVTTRSQRAVPEYELQYASIKAAPGREGDIWLTTKEALVRSTDSGKSFQKLSSVEAGHAVGFGKAAPGKSFPAVYLSGTVGGVTGFFRSDDEGDEFVRINDDAHQYGGALVISGDPRVYGRMYVAPGGRGILYGEPKSK